MDQNYHTPVNSKQTMKEAWTAGSPFQARKSNQRPKLRFNSPIQTDKWLSEREKTDYTYAKSASYSSVVARLKSLEELAISYITPILSRRSRDPVMRPDAVPTAAPTKTPNRRTVATPASSRRSARLAARGTGGFVSDRDAAPETYSRTRRMTTTTTTAYSAYDDSTFVHADDSPRSSLSNGTGSNSRNLSDTATKNRSFSGRLHDKYISHLYGLDGDEYDGECSDTESSLTATHRSRSSTSATSWETHQCDEENSSTISTISTLSKSAILYPFSVLYWLITTFLTVVSTVMFAPIAIARTVHKSSSTSSLLHSMYSMFSNCVHYVGVLVYRFFTSILLWDVWGLTRIREFFLGFLGFGYASASSFSSSSSTTTSTTLISESEKLEKERRRRSGCLCLLFLLLLPFLFYLLMGAAPILLAAFSKNETKVEETFDESAFFAASGCMKCVRKDELMLLIGGVVNDKMAGLHSQIDTQNQRILMLQQTKSVQESNIHTLTDQLAMLISSKDAPSKETLVYINSLESQITSLRGDLRNLQMAQAQQGDKDADTDVIGIAALGVLRSDVGGMEEALAALKGELKNFHSLYDSDVYRLQHQDRHLHGDVNIIGSRLVGLENRVSSDVNGLDRRLNQLHQSLQGLESDRGEDHSQLELVSLQIGVVEGNMTAARNELRELKAELAAALVSADKLKELEGKMALNADVQVLQTQLKDLQSKHTDGAKGLRDLETRFNTLHTSVTNIQLDMTHLQEHVQDIDANKFGATKLSLEQLQQRLLELETGSQDLLSGMQQLRDISSDKVDAGLVAGLQMSVSELEAKLNQLRTELQMMTDRLAGFGSRVDGVQADAGQQQASTVAMFASVREDIANLQDGSKDVIHASTHNADLDTVRTDVQKSSDKLSSDINGIKTDLHHLEVGEGSSKLVGDVSKLQAVLESVRTQLQGLDTSNTGGIEPTVAVDLAELRSEIQQTTREIQRNQASISALNSTVVVLQGEQQEQADSISKDLAKLREELSAMSFRLDELSSVKANQKELDALQLKASTVQSHVDNIKYDIESLQFQLGQLSAKSAGVKDYEALAADVSSLQAAVAGLQKQFVTESGDVNIVQLVNKVNSFGDFVEKYEESGMFGRGDLTDRGQDAVETEQLQGSLGGVQDELTRLQRDLATLNSIIFMADKDGQSQNVLQDIGAQLASVEASLEGLRTSQEGVNDEVQKKIGAVEQLMAWLRDQLTKLQSDVSDTFGAAAGASVRDDLVDVKANLSDLNEQQIKLLAQIKDCCNKSQLADIWAAGGYSGEALNWTDADGLDEVKVRNIVLSALTLYSADKTGMVDYALESAGGSVVSTRCSETFTPRTALFTVMGIPLWYDNRSPRSVIQPDMHPGNCWAFKGSEGYVVIQLSGMIKPTSFSMEHIPKTLSPTGTLDSAPKEFSVWSLNTEYETDGVLLGKYEYNQDGNPLQFFAVNEANVAPTGMVELKIHSNHGNMEYTCLYRFRVHGTLEQG